MAPIERLAERLEAPALDDRSYRVIRLPNKLEALLVHDPDTDKASAAVNVNVGSFSDADDMPGMAHAVEHLLFMGTEKVIISTKTLRISWLTSTKYPVENAYNQYLTAHSGYSNAYTAATETNYYFEVAAGSEADKEDAKLNGTSHGPLHGALDRFAQFFIAPLFLSSTLDRELRAVDSENKKNLQSDSWRLNQLDKSLSNSKHPYHHFSTGNLETLRDEPKARGVNIREEFIGFHNKHYSANRMKLVVLGKEPLDELEEWVGDLFAKVHNKDLPKNTWDAEQPYSKNELMTQVYAKPVMDQRKVDITFPYVDEDPLYEAQPSRYIAHLIGHEGPGSILAYIKAKGWANALSAGPSGVCPGSAFFEITIRLTEDGLNCYQEVVKTVFQYIALIKESPPQKWVVDEVKGMAEVDFKFQEKSPASSFASSMSSVMQKPLPREWLLSGTSLVRKFDPEAITNALSYLRADNCRLTLVSQDFPGGWDKKEKWYGTEYKMEPIESKFAAEMKKAAVATTEDRIPDLHLPLPNDFIPSKLTVEKKETAEPAKTPTLIRNDENVRIWWKKDDRFWVPKGNVFVSLQNPLTSATPSNSVKSRMFCELVKDALVEYSYNAEIAGLEYGIADVYMGISVDICGYNDKMPVLLEKVLVSMRDLEIKPDRFKVVKERVLRGFKNYTFQQPYRQVGDFSQYLSSDKGYVVDDYLSELTPMTLEDVATFFPQLLRQMHIEILCHGNLYKEDALKISDLVESTLKPRILPESQWPVKRNLLLPPGSDFTYKRSLGDPANVNHCIEYYLLVGRVTDRTLRAKLSLLGQMTSELGFDQLRTKEQLGYIVWTGQKMSATTMGYRVIIQSERTPEYLEERINAFLAMFGRQLNDMAAEEFESHKKSLISKRLEKVKNLDQESNRFWHHIGSDEYDFKQKDLEVESLRTINKSEMIEFFKQHIDPTSPARAKLSIHMVAQSSPKELAGDISPEEQKIKVVDAISKYLTMMGISADADKFNAQFEKVDVAGGDQAGIVNAISTYLKNEQTPEDETTEIVSQLEELLATILPSLGVEIKQEAAAEDEPLPEAPKVKPTTYIENVHDFKASLPLTAAAQPVCDLTEFEELEPKL